MCSCALLFASVVWFVSFKPALRIEGKERISIADFGNGATVTHAFVMPVDGLHGVSVKISVDRPSTLTFSYKLLQLSDTSPGGENRLDVYAEIHGWSDRVTGTIRRAVAPRDVPVGCRIKGRMVCLRNPVA